MNDLHARVENDFSYHPATPITGPAHDEVRTLCRSLAHYLVDYLPPSREQSLALTSLEEVMHWSNAAIAKYGDVVQQAAEEVVNTVSPTENQS